MAKILLVEDDINLREIYEARLQAEGYEIVSAKDGEEALAVAKAEKPDLVISDIMMPKISGFEMLDILRNTNDMKNLKIIMLTALGQNDDQQRADKLGADKYLVKSQVTLEDIVKATHELLEDGQSAAEPSPPNPTPNIDPPTPSPQPNINPNGQNQFRVADPPAQPQSDVPKTDIENTAELPTPMVSNETKINPPPESNEQPVVPNPTGQNNDAPSTLAEPDTTQGQDNQDGPKPIDNPAQTDNTQANNVSEENKESNSLSQQQSSSPEPTKQEQSDVDSKIENFVTGATTDATPPSATPVAPTNENQESEDQVGAEENNQNSEESSASDKVETQSVSEASNFEQPIEEEKPKDPLLEENVVIAPNEPQESPADTLVDYTKEGNPPKDQANLNSDNVTIAHKKVISPIDNNSPDIQELYAKEQAVEDANNNITPKAVVVDSKATPKLNDQPTGINGTTPQDPSSISL